MASNGLIFVAPIRLSPLDIILKNESIMSMLKGAMVPLIYVVNSSFRAGLLGQNFSKAFFTYKKYFLGNELYQ
jgi:hypothetical protein